MANEVAYNLVHLIAGSDSAIRLKADDDSLIFAQSKGVRGWLWIAQSMADEKREELVTEVIDRLAGAALLPGVNGTPDIAERFAKRYADKHGVDYRFAMGLEAYACPQPQRPSQTKRVQGEMKRATREHAAAIAAYLAGFAKDAHGVQVDAENQLEAAAHMAGSGNLYLWMVDGQPVSMANIAHRSPRHARINAVFTPVGLRKKGYASALVAGLSETVLTEGLTPMLYADKNNPDANKVYRSIGFVASGAIAEINFVNPDVEARRVNKEA